MLSVEIHSLHLKMIRLLATSVMIVNFVFSAFTISLLLTTQLIQVNFSRSQQQSKVLTIVMLYSVEHENK